MGDRSAPVVVVPIEALQILCQSGYWILNGDGVINDMNWEKRHEMSKQACSDYAHNGSY